MAHALPVKMRPGLTHTLTHTHTQTHIYTHTHRKMFLFTAWQMADGCHINLTLAINKPKNIHYNIHYH